MKAWRLQPIHLIPVILSLLAGALYLYTAAPAMLWLDSGRFLAGMVSLGIVNPPGFPLYILAGFLFHLFPFGSLIFKAQLLGVSMAVISLILVYRLIIQLVSIKNTPDRLFAVLAAVFGLISLAFSYQFWSQAAYIETFMLVSLLELLILNILLVPAVGKVEVFKKYALIAFILGLATGTNPIVISVVPSVGIYFFSQMRKLSFEKLLTLAGLGVLGVVMIYLYIPIRANQHPFLNWHNASDIYSLWTQMTGGALNVYRPDLGRINGFTGAWPVYVESTQRYFQMLWQNFTPFLLPFIGLGIWYIWSKRRFYAIILLLVPITNLILSDLYKAGNQENWYLCSWIVLAVFAGLGYYYLSQKLLLIRDGRYLAFLLLLVSIVPLVNWFSTLNRRSYYISQDYVTNLYAPIKTPAIIFGSGDYWDAHSYYAYSVAKPKEPVIPITDNNLYLEDWYRTNLMASTDLKIPETGELKFDTAKEYSRFVNQFFTLNMPKYHVYVTQVAMKNRLFPSFEKKGSLTIDEKYVLVPQGMVFEVLPKSATDSPNLANFDFQFKTPNFPQKRPTFLEKNYGEELTGVINEYAFSLASLGDYFIKKAQFDQAKTYYQKAVDFNPGNSEISQINQILLSDHPEEATKTSQLQLPAGFQEYSNPRSNVRFAYPDNWWVEENNTDLLLNEPTGQFKVEMRIGSKDPKETAENFVANYQRKYGALQNSGPARLPNFDQALVKVWLDDAPATEGKTEKKIQKLQFFLFDKDRVMELVVWPADSDLMSQMETVLQSIQISNIM